MQKYALILAGGTGSRAGGDLPKQFQPVAGRRMVLWSVDAFLRSDPSFRIVFVVHPDFVSLLKEDCNGDFLMAEGGASRIESVKRGLDFIASLPDIKEEDLVFVHDAARPCLTPDIVLRGAAVVAPGVGAVPVVPLSDSIRKLNADGSEAVNRNDFVAVQTPQVFTLGDLRRAYNLLESEAGFTDDASVAEHAGLKITTFNGAMYNLKVTHPGDFFYAEKFLQGNVNQY